MELVHLLGELKEEMVVIGGWVPSFLLPGSREPELTRGLDIDVSHRRAQRSEHAAGPKDTDTRRGRRNPVGDA
ncbi:MAG: hypothetical protein QME66_12915 [Candidatus Eisenbacteria bacterium]|nr:hypothetical protein [Candidatus Eisenbacteria bacterium]